MKNCQAVSVIIQIGQILGIDGRIILKWILGKFEDVDWIGLAEPALLAQVVHRRDRVQECQNFVCFLLQQVCMTHTK
jgi:hypothetical protein